MVDDIGAAFEAKFIERIAVVYAIERRIRGLRRRATPCGPASETKPLVDALKARLEATKSSKEPSLGLAAVALAEDWENLNRQALAFLRLASIRLMLRKLMQSPMMFPDRLLLCRLSWNAVAKAIDRSQMQRVTVDTTAHTKAVAPRPNQSVFYFKSSWNGAPYPCNVFS
jgi:hypothetical protein